MGVVRGDRIAESRKLNSCSVEAQSFYSLLVSKVPDHLGRFRLTVLNVLDKLFPRREPTIALQRKVKGYLDELGAAGLWRTWECDEVTFAELVNWAPRGNVWHRTPEPPWTDHAHNRACLPTAIARAREWSTPEVVAQLREMLSGLLAAARGDGGSLQNRGSEQRTCTSRGVADGGVSVPSVPFVPSVPPRTDAAAAARPRVGEIEFDPSNPRAAALADRCTRVIAPLAQVGPREALSMVTAVPGAKIPAREQGITDGSLIGVSDNWLDRSLADSYALEDELRDQLAAEQPAVHEPPLARAHGPPAGPRGQATVGRTAE